MDMPALPPRPAPAAVLVPVVGETAAARSRRRRWLQPQASLGLARLGGALLASSLLVWALLLALASDAAEGQQRGFQAPPQRGSGPLEVDITQGTLKPIPIAIPEFAGEDERFAVELSNVVAADLERSGLFQPLNRESFIQRLADHNATPRFSDWRAINAQALVVGRAGRAGDGRLAAEFRLWDVLSGRQLAGQRLAVGRANGAASAILIADQIYRALDRGERLFRHPDRLHRRDRSQGSPQQAPGHHGPGRRQRASVEPGAGIGVDAALQPDARTKWPSCNTPAISRACFCSTWKAAGANWSATSPA